MSRRNSSIDLLDSAIQAHAKPLRRDKPVRIFGAGRFGQDVCAALRAQCYEVSGFVETQPRHRRVMNLDVRAWSELGQTGDEQLVIAIFNRATPLDGLWSLAVEAGYAEPLLPWDAYGQLRQHLGWRYWLETPEFQSQNICAIEQALDCLADDQSRRCLIDICRFRSGRHLAFANFKHDETQYFNPITLSELIDRPICYVDAGAYDGDTLLVIASKAKLQLAFAFEPDLSNYARLAQRMKHEADFACVCLPLALSDRHEILSFNADGSEGAHANASGADRVAAVALDEVSASTRIDFIKMDIEAAEAKALHGARGIIARDRPVMAISLYHKPADLWELPILVKTLGPDYRMYIRQHACNTFDAVLYAVPAKNG